jgi:hypothetical protein
MLKNILLLIALFCSCGLQAQIEFPAAPPQVSLSEVSAKHHPADTTAAAAYLYRNGKTWFEISGYTWIMVTEVYTRLKIYKKEGYSYAVPHIAFYSGNQKSKGFFSDASTYNLVDGKVQKTPLKKEGEFKEEFREDYSHAKIALPDVHEGSVIEFKYTIKTPYFGNLNDFYFQYDIPVNHARYDIKTPVYFYYNAYIVGSVKIEESLPVTKFNSKINTSEIYFSYKADAVKAIKQEAYVNNIDNYTAMIKHELASVSMPNSLPQKLSTDWKTVANSIYDNDSFGRELKFNSYFEDNIKPLLTAGLSENEKAVIILNYVKDRMSWDGRMGYLCNTGVKKAYLAKAGNTAEINLMLTAMLRYAGLDANPVLVSTRDNGVAVYPTRYAYNYVIAAVKIEGKTILFDATSKFSSPDVIPVRALNWKGRLIKKNGDTEEIDLISKKNSREVVNVMATLNKDGSITGQVRTQYSDYKAYLEREAYGASVKEEYPDGIEKTYKGLMVDGYKMTNENDASKILMEDYTFTHNNASENIGNHIYVNPLLFLAQDENPFKLEDREYPIDFVYPYQEKYVVTLALPDGYEPETIPKPVALAMEENIGSFRYNISAVGRNIQASAVLEINYSNISDEYYKTLKDFFQKMIEKQNEKIVLVKKTN